MLQLKSQREEASNLPCLGVTIRTQIWEKTDNSTPTAKLKDCILEPRKFMQVLAGPRQVGKSTLVNQVLGQMSIPYMIEVADAVDPKDSDWIHRVRAA